MKKQISTVIVLFVITLLLANCGSSERKFTGIKLSSDDYVDMGFSPKFDANDSFTVEAWINVQDEIKASSVIFGPSRSHAFGLHTHYEGKLSFGIRTSDAHAIVETDKFEYNSWHHLAGVYNGQNKTAYFYIDGELVGSKVFNPGDLKLAQHNFVINGNEALRGEGRFKARSSFIISDLRLWNTPLSQTQIAENMNIELTGNESGLFGYWPLNEGEGNTVGDKTQKQNNGTIHGGTWYTGK